MKITRATNLLRVDLFATRERDQTTDVVVSYTDTIPDPRIDADFLDYADARRNYFGATYHYVIKTSGQIEIARDPRTISSRVRKIDQPHSILIGVVGGRDEDGNRISTINPAQREAVEVLLQSLADSLQVPLGVTDYIESQQLRDQAEADAKADDDLEAAMDAAEVN